MKKLIVILLFVFCFMDAQAQTKGKVKSYTLSKCIRVALKQNPEIQLSGARIDAANANIKGAFGQFLPGANVSAGYDRHLNPDDFINYTNQGVTIKMPNTSSPNNYSAGAALNFTIFDGFYRGANYSSAQNNYKSVTAMYDYTEQKVTRDVYRYFIDVIKKKKILEIRQDNLKLGEKELERIKARKEAGLVPVGVVYSQEAELANSEFDMISAENDYNTAKAVLLTVIGENPDEDAEFLDTDLLNEVTGADIKQFRKNIAEYERAVNEALDSRLDYVSSQYDVESANESLSASRSGYYPTLSTYVSWRWNNDALTDFGTGNSFLGLSLNIPIFDQFQTNTRIQNARLQVTQAEIQRFQLSQSIATAVKTAYMNLSSVEKQLDITARALKASERNYESAKERFRLGKAGITDFMTANTQLITAKINRINTVYTYFLTQKEVLFALGTLR